MNRRGFLSLVAGLPLVGKLGLGDSTKIGKPRFLPTSGNPICGHLSDSYPLLTMMNHLNTKWNDLGGRRVFLVHPYTYYRLLDHDGPSPWEPRGFSCVRFKGVPVFGSKKVLENNIWYVLESTVPEWMSD